MKRVRRTNPYLPTLLAVVVAALPAGPLHAQSTKDSRCFLVFGSDDRTAVTDTSQPPWSCIGLIIAHWGEAGAYQIRTGTGTLISDHVVLTAGHVLFDKAIGRCERIYFIPGDNADQAPFAPSQATGFVTTPQWAINQQDDHDMALLFIESPAGQSAGHMRIAGQPSTFFDNRTLNLSGYPSDLVWDQLYNATGQSQRLEGNVIHHFLDGGPGESGGPLWFTDQATGQPTLVGIYAGDMEVSQGGQIIDSYGYGIAINTTFCSWISEYVSQYDPGTEVSCAGTQDAPATTWLPACGTGLVGVGPMIAMCLLVQRHGLRAARSKRVRQR